MSSSDRITAVRSARYLGPKHDRWLVIRRIERLGNGMWRVDYPGGLVEMFGERPETR